MPQIKNSWFVALLICILFMSDLGLQFTFMSDLKKINRQIWHIDI